jgi:hypothetical protein
MPRKKKSDIERLIDILEDSEFTTRDLQEINRVVSRRIKRREVAAKSSFDWKEAKNAGRESSAKAASGGGPSKASSGKKD